ncbi:MAG TPA: hypothetical protein PLI43_17675 [Albidovulum sp.]|nr:hypothetical protein [Albidovulum sp.]
MSKRPATVLSRQRPVSESMIVGGRRPAVPVRTRRPPISISRIGPIPWNVRLRRARAITSTTSARGKCDRPSPPIRQPAATARASSLDVISDGAEVLEKPLHQLVKLQDLRIGQGLATLADHVRRHR